MSNNTPKDSHFARLRRQHRDQKAGLEHRPAQKRPSIPPGDGAPAGLVHLYGLHTVRAALDNPARKIRYMRVTRNALERLEIADPTALPFEVRIVEPREIDRITDGRELHSRR